MSMETPPSPREELEARLTALLLGELSAEEDGVLREAMTRDPALAQLHDRLSRTIGLVREAAGSVDEVSVAPSPSLRISPDRRSKLIESFKVVRPAGFGPKVSGRRKFFRRELASIAAMLVALLVLAGVVMQRLFGDRFAAVETLAALPGQRAAFALPEAEPSGLAEIADAPAVARNRVFYESLSEGKEAPVPARVADARSAGQEPALAPGIPLPSAEPTVTALGDEMRIAETFVKRQSGEKLPAVILPAGGLPAGQQAVAESRRSELQSLAIALPPTEPALGFGVEKFVETPAPPSAPPPVVAAGGGRATELALGIQDLTRNPAPVAAPESSVRSFAAVTGPGPVQNVTTPASDELKRVNESAPDGQQSFRSRLGRTANRGAMAAGEALVADTDGLNVSGPRPSDAPVPPPVASFAETKDGFTPADKKLNDAKALADNSEWFSYANGAEIAQVQSAPAKPAGVSAPEEKEKEWGVAGGTVVFDFTSPVGPPTAQAPALQVQGRAFVASASPSSGLQGVEAASGLLKESKAAKVDDKTRALNFDLDDGSKQEFAKTSPQIPPSPVLPDQTTIKTRNDLSPASVANVASIDAGTADGRVEVRLAQSGKAAAAQKSESLERPVLQTGAAGKAVDQLPELGRQEDRLLSSTASTSTLDSETLRKMEGERITAGAELARIDSMIVALTNYSPAELKRAMATASPDSALGRLLAEQSLEEKRLAELADDSGADRSVVEASRGRVASLSRLVDERLEGIFDDLDVRAKDVKARLEVATSEVDKARSNDVAAAVMQPPYRELKRNLETLVDMREHLNTRLWQGNVDAAVPKSGQVEIVELAEPQSSEKPTLWGRIAGAFSSGVERSARVATQKNLADTAGVAGQSAGAAAFDHYWVQTETEKIQSKDVLNQVVEKLDLNEAWADKHGGGDKLQTDETLQLLKKRLNVRQDPKTSLIDIQARGDNAEEAARLANAVAEAYRDSRAERSKELSLVGLKALEKERAEHDKKIDRTQKQLDRLKKELTPDKTDVAIRKAPATAPVPQPEVQTIADPFSTFSLNVSDVSFKLAAAALEKGAMPDPATVRSEEFINAFDYRDPEPPPGVPVAFAWERARYPFAHNRDLLRFSIKTAASGRQAGRPLNLVLLLDNSGSMERADRVRIIQECLRVLGSQLQPQDRVSVVAFARTPRLWVDGLPGNQAGELAQRVGGLTPQGGTNLEDAMNLAYQTASRHFVANGVNRVVLLTDGAANLGDVEPDSLKKKVETQRQQGIALDCFGIGWEGFNDELLETLSRNGDGRYGFVNSPEAAAKEFAGQLAGALQVAASDVKVQVQFNPRRVTSYRQIGYAKHQLKKEQFRDNTVDAAEIAAAEAGNALYTVEVNPSGEGPLATVRVRFKVPGTTDYREHEYPVPYDGAAKSLEQSSAALRLAGAASAFSEWLVVSPFAGDVTPDRLLSVLSGVPEKYGADPRPKKLEWMVWQAKSLGGK